MTTMLFYYLFIQPTEWMFALYTQYGQMLRKGLTNFEKATKFVNLMINVAASFYASSDIHHERLLNEMTKICHLAFHDLRTNANNKNTPIL